MSDGSEVLRSELARARDEAARYRNERNESRKKVAELEANLNDAKKATAEGTAALEAMTAERDAALTWEEKFKAEREVQKTTLLESLPEDKRDRYKEFDVDALRTIAADLGTGTTVAAQSQAAGQVADTKTADSYNLSEMSPVELAELKEDSPTLYNELLTKSITEASRTGGII